VSALVLRGSFRRIEHIFVLLASVFVAYIASGLLAHPDWGAAVHGLVVPTMPFTRDAFVIITATVGTTLAPWGLAFIQSYAVDKQLRPEDLRFERIDVIAGSVLTGVIGFFVVVACAATLHRTGLSIESAADAARALEPLAGDAAGTLFAVGLIGAAVLAASILPLSTAYSVCEYAGVEAALDDSYADAKPFYLTFGVVVVLAASFVLIPGAPLVTILVITQVLNAVLLLPLLVFLLGVARNRDLMGEWVASRGAVVAYGVTIAVVGACVLGLLITMLV
jgi:Mn2+/Fe2+ NRAMP family transporter